MSRSALLLSRVFAAWRSDRMQLVVLAFILLVAEDLRLNALQTWDSDSHQHPDERFMTIVASGVKVPASLGDYFNTARSSLNPYANGQSNYAYGQLPLTLTVIAANWTGQTAYESVYKVGRALSALADLGTIVFA